MPGSGALATVARFYCRRAALADVRGGAAAKACRRGTLPPCGRPPAATFGDSCSGDHPTRVFRLNPFFIRASAPAAGTVPPRATRASLNPFFIRASAPANFRKHVPYIALVSQSLLHQGECSGSVEEMMAKGQIVSIPSSSGRVLRRRVPGRADHGRAVSIPSSSGRVLRPGSPRQVPAQQVSIPSSSGRVLRRVERHPWQPSQVSIPSSSGRVLRRCKTKRSTLPGVSIPSSSGRVLRPRWRCGWCRRSSSLNPFFIRASAPAPGSP